MAVCAVVLVSYFLVTAGIAFDIINEPPAIGGERDPATGASSLCWNAFSNSESHAPHSQQQVTNCQDK